MNLRAAGRWFWVLLIATLLQPPAAKAHVGAPYPVLLEETAGPYIVSALADPDVGTGTFYVLVALPDGELPPVGTGVTVWVEPQDGHVGLTAHRAAREDTRYGERFVAKVPFESKGDWRVQVVVEGPEGKGDVSFPVEVTPSGLGWPTTLACLLPFVFLGLLWLRGSRRRRQE